MELKNMKMTSDERSEMKSSIPVDAPNYPYGLCLHLEDAAIEKLGLPALPAAEQTMMLHARVKVERVSSSETAEGKNRSLSLQITDMALVADEEKKDPAKTLYGA